MRKAFKGCESSSKMGTSSRGVANHKNIPSDRSAKTFTNNLSNLRPRSALNGKGSHRVHGSRSEGYERNTGSGHNGPASARAFSYGSNSRPEPAALGRHNGGFFSPRSDMTPSTCLLSARDNDSRLYQRTLSATQAGVPTGRPYSAAAGASSSLIQRQQAMKPRPRSSVSFRATSFPISPSNPQVGRTLDDLPMQHTQEDAFGLLERRRAELAAQRRNMSQESGEIKTVSNFSRRMFDSAVSSRGQAPPPAPSAREEAALFFRPARPSWSSQQSQDSTRLKLRPHSMTAAESSVPVRPVVSKTRPDSEPPTSSHRGREFNHLRYHRKMYPHINTLVQRYNEDMRVVCNQTPEICENRRNSRDFSVASEFLLVPLRQDEPVEEQEEETVEEPLAGSRESDLAVQQEHKTEDQLPGEMMRPETKR